MSSEPSLKQGKNAWSRSRSQKDRLRNTAGVTPEPCVQPFAYCLARVLCAELAVEQCLVFGAGAAGTEPGAQGGE